MSNSLILKNRNNKKGENRFLKNKKAEINWDIIVLVILGVLILVLVFSLLFNNIIVDWFRNLPAYKHNDSDSVVEDLPADSDILVNYYKVGIIVNSKNIKFCFEGDCNKLIDSNIYWHGNEKKGEIYVSEKGILNWDWLNPDNQIGYTENSRIYIDKNILENIGDDYIAVRENLPEHEYVLNLDNSIYISGILYKKNKVEDERKIKEGEVIEKSSEDISNYNPELFSHNTFLAKGKMSKWLKLKKPIKNIDSVIGWDTGSDSLEYVQYFKDNLTWVRFKDNDWFEDRTPWIRMDYWNKYRNIGRVPNKYWRIIDEDDERF